MNAMELWEAYDGSVRRAAGCQISPIDIHGALVELLPLDTALTLRDALMVAPARPFRWEDARRGFASCRFTTHEVREVNKAARYLEIAGLNLDAVLGCLKEPVARFLGTPWTVLNVRTWATPPNAVQFGPNDWHKDGFPAEILKIMVYATPMTPDGGGIEIEARDGLMVPTCPVPGAWVLFKNSGLRHRGIPGLSEERLCVEITLCRAKIMDLTVVDAGLNSHWPVIPPPIKDIVEKFIEEQAA